MGIGIDSNSSVAVEINGGTIDAYFALRAKNGGANVNGVDVVMNAVKALFLDSNVVVNAGAFTSDVIAKDRISTCNIVINGGTFSVDPTAYATGKTVTENGGIFTVN